MRLAIARFSSRGNSTVLTKSEKAWCDQEEAGDGGLEGFVDALDQLSPTGMFASDQRLMHCRSTAGASIVSERIPPVGIGR